jgi:hypothetical protein
VAVASPDNAASGGSSGALVAIRPAIIQTEGTQMPDDVTPTPSPTKQEHTPDHRRAINFAGPERNQAAFARWLEGMFALSQEITQFTQIRLQEDIAAWSTLATCYSPEQALDCQQRFVAKISDQYSAEIAKLSRMMMNIASQGLSFLQQQSAPHARPEPGSYPGAL